MAADSGIDAGLRALRASFHYSVNTGVKPRIYLSAQRTGRPTRRDYTEDIREMQVRDARPLLGEMSVDVGGFELRRKESSVSDYFDDEEVERVRYPEVEGLVKEATGAARVRVFDHLRRSSKEISAKARAPAFVVHNDYTERSGPQRVRDLFPDEADGLLQRRFALINAWHSIRDRVETAPLAVCDARSIRLEDFIATEILYQDATGEAFTRAQSLERGGEVFYLAHNPGHRWFYFPRMGVEEVMLFKCFDSAKDGRARFSAHSAFEDPESPPDAPPRQSIEFRALAMFD